MSKLRILKDGNTDPDSTDIWKFVFHEGYPTFKIATSGSQNVTMTAGTDEVFVDIFHNLGYNPVYFAYILKNSISMQVPYYITNTGVTVIGQTSGLLESVNYYSILSDTDTLRIGAFMPADFAQSNEAFTIYWLIMLDEF